MNSVVISWTCKERMNNNFNNCITKFPANFYANELMPAQKLNFHLANSASFDIQLSFCQLPYISSPNDFP